MITFASKYYILFLSLFIVSTTSVVQAIPITQAPPTETTIYSSENKLVDSSTAGNTDVTFTSGNVASTGNNLYIYSMMEGKYTPLRQDVFVSNVIPKITPIYYFQAICYCARNQTITGSITISPLPSAPVPEPATIALLGIGLVGLAGAETRRRRKKQNAVENS